MMKPLNEIEIIQNPALGSLLMWEFGKGFQSETEQPASLLHYFLVLPLLLHNSTQKLIVGTRRSSGLLLFAAKLSEEREQLIAVHERALVLRSLSLTSVAFGISYRLLSLDYATATLRANGLPAGLKKLSAPERIRPMCGAAEKLGYWFSKVQLAQIALTLAVAF